MNKGDSGCEGGFALVSTLLLLALLVGVAVPLGMLARLQVKVSAYDERLQQARQLAWAAVQAVAVEMPPPGPFGYPDQEEMEGWLVSSEELLPEEAGGFTVLITDEAGKIPLSWQRGDILSSLPGVDEAISDAMLDWVDEDIEERPNGAEEDAYNEYGYYPRNGMPPDVGELGLVAGVTDELLWGEEDSQAGLASWIAVTDAPPDNSLVDANRADAEDLLAIGLSEEAAEAIVTYRTEHGPFSSLAQISAVPEVGWGGLRDVIDRLRPAEARLNINTADAVVLDALPSMTAELRDEIVIRRVAEPFQGLSELWDLSYFDEANGPLLDLISVNGGAMHLQITAWPAQGKPVVTAEATLGRNDQGIQLLFWRCE